MLMIEKLYFRYIIAHVRKHTLALLMIEKQKESWVSPAYFGFVHPRHMLMIEKLYFRYIIAHVRKHTLALLMIEKQKESWVSPAYFDLFR